MKLIVFPTFQHHLFRAGLWLSLIVIVYLATIRIDEPLPGHFSDKFYHGLCFAVLAFLTDYAYPKSGFGPRKYIPLFLYGVMIEVIQYFIPYRSFSLADMVADALGLGIYGLAAWGLSRFHHRLIRGGTRP
jgi:VanZ family protein